MTIRRALSGSLGVAVAATLAALVYTWPLALHATSAIPFGRAPSVAEAIRGLMPGDHLQFLYFLSLPAEAAAGRAPFLRDAYEFSAPEPQPHLELFFLPFSLLFAALVPLGHALAYNVLVWLSFPATAVVVFLLARELGVGRTGAAAAAAAVTLLPYRLGNVASGHPAGIVYFLLPLVFLGIERGRRTGNRWAAAVGGAAAAVLALNEPHFLFFVVLLLPVWVLSVFWRTEPARRPPPDPARSAILAGAAVGPAVLVSIWFLRRDIGHSPPLVLAAQWAWTSVALWLVWRLAAEIRARAGDEAWRAEALSLLPLAVLAAYALQLRVDVPLLAPGLVGMATFLVAVRNVAVLRALVVLARRDAVRAAALRLVSLWPFWLGLLAAVGLTFYWKTGMLDVSGTGAGRTIREVVLFSPDWSDLVDRSNGKLARYVYPGLAVVVLAIFGTAVRRARPLLLLAAIFGVLGIGIGRHDDLLLYRALWEFVPYFNLIRQPAKLFSVVALALGIAAGFGVGVLREKTRGAMRAAVPFVAIAAIAIDFAASLPFGLSLLPGPNRSYDVVAERGRGTNLLEIPIWPGDSAFSSLYQAWTLRTRVPVVNGYSPMAKRKYLEGVVRPLDSMNIGELTADQHRLLDELRVRFVTLHRPAFAPQVSAFGPRYTLAAMRANPNLRRVEEDGGVFLFERPPGPYREWPNAAGWPIGYFLEAESMMIGTGAAVDEPAASGGRIARGGEPTARKLPVVFGPYRVFPRGRYEARFRAEGRGIVEVATRSARQILGRSRVDRAGFGEEMVPFVVDRAGPLEFRGWAASGQLLALDWIHVRKVDGAADDGEPVRLEAEDLPTITSADVEAADASGGGYAAIGGPPEVPLRDGPWRIHEAGPLELRIRARGGAFRLRVETADGSRVFLDQPIAASPDWSETIAATDVPERTVLCTRFVSTGVPADVDWIELRGPDDR